MFVEIRCEITCLENRFVYSDFNARMEAITEKYNLNKGKDLRINRIAIHFVYIII